MRHDHLLRFREVPAPAPRDVPAAPSEYEPRVLVALSQLGPWSSAREAWLSELDRRIAALDSG